MKILFLFINPILKLLLMFVGCFRRCFDVVFAEMQRFLKSAKYSSRFFMILLGCYYMFLVPKFGLDP
jgi:hypothetical protein